MSFRLFSKVLLIGMLVSLSVFSQNRSQAYIEYINQYYPLAVQQQKEYGIPASITLAQGLLESSAGLSPFALESNNHFGIKCSDWDGDKIYHDDDEKGECFRKYKHVVESYEDHSMFLKKKSRYAFLFDLTPTDYEGWAYGLKKAGYATDPTYAYKLISLIENYDLHQFDLGQSSSGYKTSTVYASNNTSSGKSVVKHGSMGAVVDFVSHEVRKVNGVKFVTALSGDNYKLIADEFNMSLKRLLSYNDLEQESTLSEGTRVFIGRKKNKAPKECLTHTVSFGESMRGVSQDYGMKVIKLYRLNKMSLAQGPYVGQVLKLR